MALYSTGSSSRRMWPCGRQQGACQLRAFAAVPDAVEGPGARIELLLCTTDNDSKHKLMPQHDSR